MQPTNIEKVKAKGAVENLHREITGSLYQAKRLLDEATTVNFKTFTAKVEEAQEYIADAARLVKEYRKISDQLNKMVKPDATTH